MEYNCQHCNKGKITAIRNDSSIWQCDYCTKLFDSRGLIRHGKKLKDSLKEKINHPNHYGGDTLYEVIKVTEAWEKMFNIGSHLVTAITYQARAKLKGTELEDLKKALWYLDRRIKQLEEDENVNK